MSFSEKKSVHLQLYLFLVGTIKAFVRTFKKELVHWQSAIFGHNIAYYMRFFAYKVTTCQMTISASWISNVRCFHIENQTGKRVCISAGHHQIETTIVQHVFQ
ncbi:unnamed protein product [Owenia fusiformis]|uniref:Uncharacterized protein n=1 Tax=Owenia fusiformis TaxID=6347 RepID=A0A8S4Q8S1_OWEFU|nr:unnamed protein product [Owenia fusiformis]